MKTLLWIDDIRDPLENDWLVFSPIGRDVGVHWVKSYSEFTEWVMKNGLPNAICFDHDLGGKKDGYDCAKWLVDYCIDNCKKLPDYAIQSANPVGKENIDKLLKNYLKQSRNGSQIDFRESNTGCVN